MAMDPPDEYVAVLREFALMPDDQYAAMYSVIQEKQPRVSHTEWVPGIESATGREDARHMLEALMSLAAFSDTLHEMPEVLFGDVAASSSLDLPDAAQATLTQRLLHLLDNGPLYVLQKSKMLALEHDLLFLNSRIITDVRPVFGRQIEESPPAVILHHMLRVTYQHEGQTSTHSYALDDRELKQLRDDVERAITKAETLDRVFDTRTKDGGS